VTVPSLDKELGDGLQESMLLYIGVKLLYIYTYSPTHFYNRLCGLNCKLGSFFFYCVDKQLASQFSS